MVKGIKKRLLPALLALSMICGLLPEFDFTLTAHAEGTVIAGNWTDYAAVPANDGTTYTISSAGELAWVAIQVNTGANNFSGKTLDITVPIDLSDHYWVPIGNSVTNSFQGIVQGNNNVISGLTIGSAASPDTTCTYAGLFGYVKGATGTAINNVALRNSAIYSSSTHIGGLAAYMDGANTISGCSVTGYFYHGGTAGAVIGGLLGYKNNTGKLTMESNWTRCIIYSSFLGNTGGIAGDIRGSSISVIRNCFAAGRIVGLTDASPNVGGLVGFMFGQILNSFSNCSIEVEGGTAYAGGIAGYSSSGIFTKNVYAAGSINTTSPSRAGMFMGYTWTGMTTAGCYWNNTANPTVNKAFASGDTPTGGERAEGLAGNVMTGLADMADGSSFLETLNNNADSIPILLHKDWVQNDDENGGFPYPDLSGDGTFPAAVLGPTVFEPVIHGTVQVGEQLIANYKFYDVGGLLEKFPSGTTFQWYRANSDGSGATAIPGETARYYTLSIADGGKNIYYVVTPKNSAGTAGVPVQSAIAAVPASPGTEGNPYKIYTLDELKNIANAPDAYYVLMNDITGALDSVICPGGTSIFTGHLDGGGYTVTLAITGSSQYTGMFGVVGSGGTIHDLNITGSVSGTQVIGGVAAGNEGTISYCDSSAAISASGNVSADVWVGGITGENKGTITDCSVTGTLGAGSLMGTDSLTAGFGGIAGHSSTPAGYITNCHANLTSFSVSADIFGALSGGGIAGVNDGSASITNCYTENNVSLSLDSEEINSGVRAGGIAGENYTGSITNCFATGNVSGSGGNNGYTGGIVGQSRGNFGGGAPILISDSFYFGTVYGIGNVGGIAGCLDYSAIAFCYSAGSVTGPAGAYLGGLTGYNNGTLQNCYSNSYGASGGGLYGNRDGAYAVEEDCYWNRNNTAAAYPAEASLSFVQMTDSNAAANMPELDFPTHFVTMAGTATARYLPQLAIFANSTDPAIQAASLASVTMAYAAPSITGQPADQTVTIGGSAQFTVTAAGSSTLTYQWKKGGGNLSDGDRISGATTATISIAGTVKADEGSYTCYVTDGASGVTSSAAILTVNLVAPSITTQPSDRTISEGGNTSFTVAATGTTPLSYQWKKNGSDLSNGGSISGATTATLTITGVQMTDAGSYTCYVSNDAGNMTSASATLTVNSTAVVPSITWQPEDREASAGWVVEFWLSAQGTAPLTYQWYKDGSPLSEVGKFDGTTASNLIISNVQETDEGEYYCVVSNAAGNKQSDTVTLTVNPIQPSIAKQPLNETKTVGDSVSFAVYAAGSEPLNYQWRKDGASLTNGVSASGATISGTTTSTLNISGLQITEAGNYSCTISNDYGNVTSNAGTLTVSLTHEAPSIILQPMSQTSPAGQAAVFTIEATGNTPLNYQWYKDGNALGNEVCYTGINTPSLHIGSIIEDYAGTYTCVVTNAYGSATSAGAVLTVGAVPVVNATISPDTGSFDRKTANQADVQTTITWGSASGISDIKAGSTSIGTDNYNVLVNTLTIKKEYLAAQSTGSLALTVEFNAGAAATLTITITDTTPPIISPMLCIYDLNAPADVTTTIIWNSAATVTDVVYSVNTDTTVYTMNTGHYIVVGNDLTINDSFFNDISVTTGDSFAFTITFDTDAIATLTVNVVDGYVPSGNADLSSLSVNGTSVSDFDPRDPDGTEYDVELLYGASIATVTATASDPKAQVNIIQATSLPGSATVTVTAEDKTTTKTYRINLTVEAAPITTYTVTASAGSGGSISPSGAVSVRSGSSQAFTITPNPGYRINSVTVDGVNQGAVTTYTFTDITADHTINATFTSTNSDDKDEDEDEDEDRGAPSTPATPDYKAKVDVGNGSDMTLPVTVDKNSGKAGVDVGKIIGFMSGGKTTVITVPSVPDADTYMLGVPVPNLTTPDEQGEIVFKTDNGSVTVPSNMLTGLEGISGSKAQISIGLGDKSTLPAGLQDLIGDRPLVQLTLSIDGKQTDWSNPNAAVTVSIPYTPTDEELSNPESIVVWYIDGSGNVVTVPNGHYDPVTGTVIVEVTHFSNYAVAYNKVSFNDVPASAWYHDAVSFIAARNITSGTGNGNYSPDAKLTRGEFIVLMMRAYGISPDTDPTDNFTDAGNTYYTGYLAAAKRLGISEGVGNNMYMPGKEITNQEMFTLLHNALKVIGQLPQGEDGNGVLTPAGMTTRAEMAQVLYNLLEK
ncbi:MAG: immunoglobulin domain-containing protein [Clostridiaceae bacterium]|nr:immunoglobulin domain-containing protein [Clostridiaceae bacterium]